MRYLGGKSRIAKEIATIVAPQGFWWEPFCGGLSVSVQLAKYGPGLVSDVNPALISLYTSVARGWLPPEAVTEEDWRAAQTLPDHDPRKGFAGFGCSFAGTYFDGFARPTPGFDYAGFARRSLLRDLPLLAHCAFRLLSFIDISPATIPSQPECIYADPPYVGTRAYKGTPPFDHGRFWAYCQEWAARGVRVFVSEYVCPVGADVVWEKNVSTVCATPKAATSKRAAASSEGARLERLFRVQAPSVARCA